MGKMTGRRKRRKLSKLLKSPKQLKKRIPTCKGGFAFKSKKDYNRAENKKVTKRDLNE